MGTIRCPSCGQALAKGSNFCRMCGARYTPAAPPPPVAEPRHRTQQPPAHATSPRRNRVLIVVTAALMAIGAGAAVALLLAAGGDSSSTTTVLRRTTTTPAPPPAGGSIEAGRYVQAGTFQTADHAEMERVRLAGLGIDVEVMPSDGAQELYPGFQVLLRGPLRSAAEESTALRSLHQNGVPSAFARDLTAAANSEAEAVAGSWAGEVERTSNEDPKLNGVLPAILTVASNGTVGSLDLPTLQCHASLSLASTTGYTFSYRQDPPCAGSETLTMRLTGNELMLTMLSPATDSFALGTLNQG